MNNLLTILLLFAGGASQAQTLLKGKVHDKATQQPIEFVNILVSGPLLEHPIGTLTDVDGSFKLSVPKGLHELQISSLGQDFLAKEIEIGVNVMDLGTILVENTHVLDELLVIARRRIIRREVDRLVFDVENSTRATVGDALEVLRVTPGVRVQNDNITMIGKSDLQVMINNKLVQMSNQDLGDFLKSIASEDIQSIEVISTPPAKYEASGNSGLINIILKQAKKDSWNAQVRSSLIQRRFLSGNAGTNFNFNKNNLTLSTSMNARDGIYYQEQDDYAHFPDDLWYTHSPFKSAYSRLHGRLDLGYQLSPGWSLGGQYLFNQTKFNITDSPSTAVVGYDSEEVIRLLQSEGVVRFKPEIHSINFNNEVRLDTLGRLLTLNLDYFTFGNPDNRTYSGVSTTPEPEAEQFFTGTNTNRQNVINRSAKIDIEYPLDWVSLTFGGKVTNSKSSNNISFFNSGLVDNPVTDWSSSHNDFEYGENIQAVYFSANKQISEAWNAQMGFRVESTHTRSKSNNLNLAIENKYTKLFPTIYLSYAPTDNLHFSLNYSKRIKRPSFFELNPNIYFVNPFQTIEGNAFLQPAFIDNIELTGTYKNTHIKFYYSHEDDLFSQVPLADASTKIIRFTNENFIVTNRIGVSQNYTFDKVRWWTSNNSWDVNYSKSIFDLEEQHENQQGLNARISTYNDFNLNSERTLLCGLNFWYSLPGVSGVFTNRSASSLSLYMQILLLGGNLNITLRGNDLFRSAAERNESRVNGIYQTARYYYDSKSVQLSVSYKFGNNDLRTKSHTTGNVEERGRTGN